MKTKNQNLIVLLNSFWTHGHGITGGDQMAIQIFKRISRSFESILWITNLNGKLAIQKEIQDLHCITSPKIFDKFGVGISYVLRLILLSFRLPFISTNYIYAGSDFFPDVFPAYFYKLIYRKRVAWAQCVFHIYPSWRARPGSKFKSLIGKMAQKISLLLIMRADIVITINDEVKDYLIKFGINPNLISVITPGVDLDRIYSILEREPKNNLTYDAVFLGRLSYSKGIFDLPFIWAELQKISKNRLPKLAIIGGGNSEIVNKLRGEVKRLKLESYIDILGFLDEDRVYELFRGARIFVFPSHEEGFGIVIAEAIAFGLPVICWNLSVYRGLYQNFVNEVPIGDHVMFAEEINRALTLSTISTAQSRAFINRYDWNEKAEQIRALLVR